MRELSILFSGQMVRAILGCRKTQTRRVVKNQPVEDVGPVRVSRYHPTVIDRRGEEAPGDEIFGAYSNDGDWGSKCPYGEPGDRLCVRETFFAYGRWETRFSTKTSRDEWHFVDMTAECDRAYQYAADNPAVPVTSSRHGGATPAWWKRPAIFMPRNASRVTLEVTGVRVERLQHCSDDDAWAEGCPDDATWSLDWYRALWDTINGAGSWETNPWVWVVEFRRFDG